MAASRESYWTNGTCARQIIFTVEDNKVYGVRFMSGCSGNLQAVSKLVEGRNIDEVIEMLKGIRCQNNTSCPDQLALALIEHKEKNQKE